MLRLDPGLSRLSPGSVDPPRRVDPDGAPAHPESPVSTL